MENILIAAAGILGVVVGLIIGMRIAKQNSGSDAGLASTVEMLQKLLATKDEQLNEKITLQATKESVEKEMRNLTAQLEEFKRTAAEAGIARAKAETDIQTRLGSINELYDKLNSSTTALSHALTKPQDRGAYGQASFEAFLEMMGMKEHTHYETQHNIPTGDGKLIPDFALKLPNNNYLIVDAKFPMSAYLAAEEAEDDATREKLMLEHAKAILKHAKDLQSKHYSDHVPGPNFVAMYVPFDAVLIQAMKVEPLLIKQCNAMGVIPISPSTAYSLLNVVMNAWTKDNLAQGAAKLAQEATTFVNKIADIGTLLAKVGSQLGTVANTYNQFVSQFNNSFFNGAKRLQSLGAEYQREMAEVEQTSAQFREVREFEGIIEVEPIDELPAADE